jgi:hypothetical protein
MPSARPHAVWTARSRLSLTDVCPGHAHDLKTCEFQVTHITSARLLSGSDFWLTSLLKGLVTIAGSASWRLVWGPQRISRPDRALILQRLKASEKRHVRKIRSVNGSFPLVGRAKLCARDSSPVLLPDSSSAANRDAIHAVVGWPLAARAQQGSRLPTIGFLGSDASGWGPWTTAFARRLRELGWIDGRTIAVEYRWQKDVPLASPRSQPSSSA